MKTKRSEFIIERKFYVYGAGLLCFVASAIILAVTLWETPEQVQEKKVTKIINVREQLSNNLKDSLLNHQYPEQVSLDIGQGLQSYRVTYTLDADLQKEADRMLQAYKPDYGSVVVMNAETGQVLAISSYNRREANSTSLAYRNTFPAASIFKIVTATAALDKYHLDPETVILFNGANHTLYRKNVMSDKVTRWTREMSLREAFAKSVNTVFGRIALEKLQPNDLQEYAQKFGFNQQIRSDLPVDVGFTEIPQDKSFELTEIASGYNRITTLSPLHGAMIGSAVAAEGRMPIPYIVQNLKDQNGQVVFESQPMKAGVSMAPDSALKLKELMEATITEGTSRRSFKPLVRNKKFKELYVGGKTGSLTGMNPRGKTDWFVGFAIGEHSKLAIAAVTVNVDYWTVKSSHLAQALFQRHYKDEFSEANQKFFQAEASESPASR